MLRPGALALALLCCHGAVRASPLPDYPFVTASGKAELWLAPDIGELRFELVAQNRSAEAALRQINEASAALTLLFTEHGVAAADIGAFDLGKKILEVGKEDDAAGTAFSAILTRHFTVHVRDLRQWPDCIGAVLARDGIDNVGVAFDRADREQLNGRLTVEAAQNARQTAADMALAFGRKAGPVVAISKGAFDNLGAPFGYGAAQEAATKPAAAPPAPGTLNYAVPSAIQFAQSVHAVFKLK